MSKSRIKSKSLSQYAKSKQDNPKTINRSISKSKSRNSWGISRVLRKRNAKYVSSPQVNKLRNRLSSEEGNSLYPSLMNAIFSNQNICIFPKKIPILAQAYNSYTDYIPLNQAFSPEEYKDFEKHIIGDSLELYQDMFLKESKLLQ